MNVPPNLRVWCSALHTHRVVHFVGVLRNRVEAVVAGVLEVALPAADQRAAGGFLVDVGVHNAQVLRYVVAIHGRCVAVVVAVVGDMRFVHDGRRKDVRVAEVVAARMGGIDARSAARGKVRELRCLAINGIVVAEADEQYVVGRGVPVDPAVEGVVLVVLPTGCRDNC